MGGNSRSRARARHSADSLVRHFSRIVISICNWLSLSQPVTLSDEITDILRRPPTALQKEVWCQIERRTTRMCRGIGSPNSSGRRVLRSLISNFENSNGQPDHSPPNTNAQHAIHEFYGANAAGLRELFESIHSDIEPEQIQIFSLRNKKQLHGVLSIDTDRLALPDRAGKVPLRDWLSPHLLPLLDRPDDFLTTEDVTSPFPAWTVKTTEEHFKLIRRLQDIDMLAAFDPKEVPVPPGGVMAVPKDTEFDRLIADLRPANMHVKGQVSKSVIDPHLPHVWHLRGLLLRPDEIWRLWMSDLSNWFYQLAVPRSIQRHYALGPVVPATWFDEAPPVESVQPCLKVCPMGHSWSVTFSQNSHFNLLDRHAALPPGGVIDSRNQPSGTSSDLFALLYIDDLVYLSRDSIATANRHHDSGPAATLFDKALDAYASANVAPQKKKIRRAFTSGPLYGYHLDGVEGVAEIDAGIFLDLFDLTHRFLIRSLSCDVVPILLFESLLGVWTHSLLLRRDLLCLFHQCYTNLTAAKASRERADPFTPVGVHVDIHVRSELFCVMHLAVFSFLDFRCPFDTVLHATDASSKTAGGAEAETHSPDLVASLFLRNAKFPTKLTTDKLLVSEYEQAADSSIWNLLGIQDFHDLPWKETFKYNFPSRSFDSHINLKELRAHGTLLRRRAKNRASWGTRSVGLIDSGVCTGALGKGRSSSFPINQELRKILPYTLGCNFFHASVWLPSHLNPSDAPTRAYTIAEWKRRCASIYRADPRWRGPKVVRIGEASNPGPRSASGPNFEYGARSATTHARNQKTWQLFDDWCWVSQNKRPFAVLQSDPPELTKLILTYFDFLWHNDKPRTHADKLIPALLQVAGEAHVNIAPYCLKQLNGALRRWRAEEPSKHFPPFNIFLSDAITATAVALGDTAFALAFALGVHCLLRPGELFAITRGDMMLYPPRADYPAACISIRQPKTKTIQALQHCTIIDRPLAEACYSFFEMLPNDAKLVSDPGYFRTTLEKYVLLLDPEWKNLHGNPVPRCLRATGATDHYLRNESVSALKVRGRWFADGSLHCYIQGAVASIVHTPSARVVKLASLRQRFLILLYQLRLRHCS